jgi:uncharacterized protein YqgC (DUF456 family)
MEILLVVLLLLGIAGAFLPVLPGPLFSSTAIGIAAYANHDLHSGVHWFWICLGLLVFLVDFLLPSYFTKKMGGSKYAARGALIGLLLSLVFPPSLFIGAFLGAFVGEMLHQSDVLKGLKSAFFATLGLVSGLFVKLIYSCAAPIYLYLQFCA